ncbi:MAG: 50S ribosomal protein L13 [Proteobacteria bacterium]|nr:50S ribosomal protein L13 [Pseudomonadota bacterium]
MSKTGVTYSCKPSDIKRKWWVVDAQDLVLGRLSSIVAKILRGKHKADYTPHMDCGDYVIITNAEKVFLTGNKLADKNYYWHTGYPGGIKSVTAGKVIDGQFPERVLRNSIERMISRNPLGRTQLKKLFIYKGESHPHSAQQPEKLDIASMNPKNSKRK